MQLEFTRNCVCCKKAFTFCPILGHVGPQFCSAACHRSARRKAWASLEFNCIKCGQPFERNSRFGMFCKQCRRPAYTREEKVALFNARFVRGRDTDCWLWIGGLNPCGYGIFPAKIDGEIVASRITLLLSGVDIGTFCACHKCDNPACVNPSHLFLGTHQENMDDMNAKKRGRYVRGSATGMAKLTETDIPKIRADRRKGMILEEIAKKHGVSRSLIGNIIDGKNWSHVK